MLGLNVFLGCISKMDVKHCQCGNVLWIEKTETSDLLIRELHPDAAFTMANEMPCEEFHLKHTYLTSGLLYSVIPSDGPLK